MIALFRDRYPYPYQAKHIHNAEIDDFQLYLQQIAIPITHVNGVELELLVKENDQVFVGSKIAARKETQFPIYSSVSGIVKGKVMLYHPIIGRKTAHLMIENDGKYLQASPLTFCKLDAPKEALLESVKLTGIIENKGVGNPLYQILENPKNSALEHIVINGMLWHGNLEKFPFDWFYLGVQWLLKILGLTFIDLVLPTTDLDKTTWTTSSLVNVHFLSPTIQHILDTQVINTIYGDTMHAFSGQSDKVIAFTLENIIQLGSVLSTGAPITKTPIEIRGVGVQKPIALTVPIGSLMTKLIEIAGGYVFDEALAYLGIPLLAKIVSEDQFVITPLTPSYAVEKPLTLNADVCTHCGACAGICPVYLQPVEIKHALQQDNTQRLLKLQPQVCLDCGLCNVVCPANLDMMDAVKKAKLKVKVALAKAAMVKK
jgi:Na+-translocating ferredoxin:NAD+ oxidoreductase subunit C